MTYSAMPSRFIPYDADGTVVGVMANRFSAVSSYITGGLVNLNAQDPQAGGTAPAAASLVFFWPESRTLLGFLFFDDNQNPGSMTWQGSNDTTNGLDGTFETASTPSGTVTVRTGNTTWRYGVLPMTFTGSKTVLRAYYNGNWYINGLHFYGVKASGQTPDDVIFLDGDTSFAEYTVDKDFGDRPLGTTVVKQFKIKNTSATKTANNTVVTCNDTDFAISTDGVTYVTTFTIATLGAGVSSATLYIRNTTPAPGAALGPRMVRLSAAVGSYT
jgi:hypothetical protein